jgi:uncharacterized membrane protein
METSEEKKSCETKKCGCFCHKMLGLFIVVIGVLILLRTLDVIPSTPFWITISILVILIGLKAMCRGCKCCDKA